MKLDRKVLAGILFAFAFPIFTASLRADTATLMHNDRVEVLAVGMNERGRRIARLIRRTSEGPKQIGGIWRAGQGRGRVEPEDAAPTRS